MLQGNAGPSITKAQLVKLPLVDGVEYVYDSKHLLGSGAAGKVYAGDVEADCLQDLHSIAVKVPGLTCQSMCLPFCMTLSCQINDIEN